MDRRSGADRRSLTGAQKAAALLITMGRDSASRLLKHLDPSDVRDITRAAATLGIVEGRALESLIEEFAAELAEGPKVIGSIAEAEQIGAAALAPAEVSSLLADLTGPKKQNAWDVIRQATDERVVKLLDRESLQVAAFVVSRLDPDRAARVCAQTSDERRTRVLARILTMRPLSPAVHALIEDRLVAYLSEPVVEESGRQRPALIANIVNRLEPSNIAGALDALSRLVPGEAERVRSLVFQFEDIVQLTQQARSAVFDEIATERVVLALKGASADVCSAVMGSLGARARRMVEAELTSDAMPPPKEVAAARRLICDTALRLAESGVISLSAPQSEA